MGCGDSPIERRNHIIAEIYIGEQDINKEIRIINSYEQASREDKDFKENYKKENRLKDEETDNIYPNEKEIKRCKIKINGKLNKFSYFYKFNQKGEYNIQYSFPIKLTNITYMFYGCNSLTYIDLSNFNTQNVTNMSHMFNGCNSLTKIIKKLIIKKNN